MADPIEVVLFDMGGVLVKLGNLAEEFGVTDISLEDFWARWLSSPAVRALERGEGDVDTFADRLAEEFGLALSRQEVITRFAAVTLGLFPGAEDLVRSVRSDVRTGLLSNTNALHWENQPDNEIVDSLCKHNYISYQIGLLKPDREIFDYVVADLGVAAGRVLFIDDNQKNVDGARAAGLRSDLAKGPEQAAAVLDGYGLRD